MGTNGTMEHFLEQRIGTESLIYDRSSHECHTLSEEALYIREELLKGTSLSEISRGFETKFRATKKDSEAIVQEVAQHLAGLSLIPKNDSSSSPANLTRRHILKVAGLTLVTSILTPMPAAADSSGSGLSITEAAYLNNQTDSPNTVPFCGTAGTNGPCNFSILTFASARVTQNPVSGGTDTFATFVCNNATLTDPCNGILKECKVTYCCNGTFTTIRVCEKGMVVIPDCVRP